MSSLRGGRVEEAASTRLLLGGCFQQAAVLRVVCLQHWKCGSENSGGRRVLEQPLSRSAVQQRIIRQPSKPDCKAAHSFGLSEDGPGCSFGALWALADPLGAPRGHPRGPAKCLKRGCSELCGPFGAPSGTHVTGHHLTLRDTAGVPQDSTDEHGT
jgi:hypothetical protein